MRQSGLCYSWVQVELYSRKSALGGKLEQKAVKLHLLPGQRQGGRHGLGSSSRAPQKTQHSLHPARTLAPLWSCPPLPLTMCMPFFLGCLQPTRRAPSVATSSTR